MKLIATADQYVRMIRPEGTRQLACAIGRSGMIAAADKTEGDGASPIGAWPLRRVFYRADRLSRPDTQLDCLEITQQQGWCDAPDDPKYNQLIARPYPASHEVLWREDHVYDLIVELGHNDRPPISGLGSAIFMHIARPDYSPTEGCIALSQQDLLDILAEAVPGTILQIDG